MGVYLPLELNGSMAVGYQNNSSPIFTTQFTTVLVSPTVYKNITIDEELCIRNPIYRNVLLTLFMITVCFSSVENVLLWVSFGINKALRTHANVYVVSLSVSDFITTSSIGWLEFYYVWDYPYWKFGEIGSIVQNSFWCLSLVTPFAHVTAITVDRYRAIASTRSYRRRTSLKREMFIVLMIWMYSVGVVVLMAFHFTPAPGYFYQWNVIPEWYYPFIAIHITVPLFLCSTLYMLILKKALKSRSEINNFQTDESKQEFKLTRTIFIIISLLFAVWLPVIAMEVVYALLAHTCVVAQIGTLSVWLTCTSGVINPIVFIWKNRKFRATVMYSIFCFNPASEKYSTSTCRTSEVPGKSVISSTYHTNASYDPDHGK